MGPNFARLDLLCTMTIPNMSPHTRNFIRDALTLIGVLAILTLLAGGHIAATFLITMPMVFLLFGRAP
jgi:hypothetical protein